MNSRKRSGSGIFLMEMIMVCGFFLLCAAVCIRVFVRSDAMSRLAREKNQAVLAAESLAETWKAEGMEAFAAVQVRPLSDGETAYTLFFDKNWTVLENPAPESEDSQASAYYMAELTLGEESGAPGKIEYLNLVLKRGTAHPYSQERDKDGQVLTLYSLQVKKYRTQGEDGYGKE